MGPSWLFPSRDWRPKLMRPLSSLSGLEQLVLEARNLTISRHIYDIFILSSVFYWCVLVHSQIIWLKNVIESLVLKNLDTFWFGFVFISVHIFHILHSTLSHLDIRTWGWAPYSAPVSGASWLTDHRWWRLEPAPSTPEPSSPALWSPITTRHHSVGTTIWTWMSLRPRRLQEWEVEDPLHTTQDLL